MSAWLVTGLLALSYGPIWGWKSASVIGLFAATVVLIPCWISSETRSQTPMVDMKMMRIPAVWSTNLAALLFGFGMFAMFITVPQFVQTPARVGYGFGASVTQSGLYLLPFAVAMLVIAPLTGRLTVAHRLQAHLDHRGALRCVRATVFWPSPTVEPWNIYVAAGLLGISVAFGSPRCRT